MGAAAGGTADRRRWASAAWEKNEADGAWWDRVSSVQEAGGRHVRKVVQVRAASVRPLEPLEAHQQVLRRGAWP